MPATENLWYKDAIFYEVYVRGFFDANGDGDGDLIGLDLEARLPPGARRRLSLADADLSPRP